MDKPTPQDYSKPVAYDVDGRPLYAHPYQDNHQSKATEKLNQKKSAISDTDMLRHERSKKAFPNVHLDDGDFVIGVIRRNMIGLLVPFITGMFLVSVAFFFLFNYDLIAKSLQLTGTIAQPITILLPVIIFVLLVIIGEYIVYFIYSNNTFILTNDNIIQNIQTGLFSKSEHIVSLDNVEDASFSQDGVIQQLLNYGSIRLSTVGNETTYRFTYVSNPKEQITTLHHAIEDFKDRHVLHNN